MSNIVTARSIIEAAYSIIGVYDTSSALTQYEYQVGLSVFNDLLDSWDNLNLLVYSSNMYTFPFTQGQQTYQLGSTNPFVANILGNQITVLTGTPTIVNGYTLIGPGIPANTTITGIVTGNVYSLSWTAPTPLTQINCGLCSGTNWNIPRPNKVERISIQYNPGTQPVELPIAMIDLEAWQSIPVKNTVSNYPIYCYNDTAFPYMNLNFWPIPSSGVNCLVYAWDQQPSLANLSDVIEVPKGYSEAYKKNLAIELCPYFDREPSPSLLASALTAKIAINNINAGIPELHIDPMWSGKSNEGLIALNSHGRIVF